MKITQIGVLPPEKSLGHYCLHLTKELAKIVDVKFLSFKNLVPPGLSRSIIAEKKKKPIIIPNVDIHYSIDLHNPFSWISAAMKAEGKVVHLQHWAWYTGLVSCLMLPIVKIRGKKIIISVHNITPHVLKKHIVYTDKLFNKIIFAFSNHFIVHNIRNKDRLMELYSIPEDQISIITHGILKFDYKTISKNQARKHLDLPQDKKIILFFGYLWRYKGLDIILKAMPSIKNKIKNTLLLVAGRPFNDWHNYEKIIKNENISDYVIERLGYIPDSEAVYYFSAADLSVFPYRPPFDTHGGAAALALSFKKPFVVSDIGGLPEYVLDKKAVFKPENFEELSEKIIQILNDDKLYNKLSKDTEKRYNELTWDKIAKQTVDVYKSLIKE